MLQGTTAKRTWSRRFIGQSVISLSWVRRAQFCHTLPHIGGMPPEGGTERADQYHLSLPELRELGSLGD